MSERFRYEEPDDPPEVAAPHPPLPPWLVRRLIRPGEQVTWVSGPHFNPSCERYLTHPALFLVALALGGVWVAAGRLIAGEWSEMSPVPVVVAAALVFASIFVLGLANGYFTRLVVTDTRLLILQGYEVCRSWGIDDLPRSLIRYRPREDGEGGEAARAVDLEAMKKMLGGGASGQFTDAKTILEFGKQLERIKARGRRT